MLGISRRFGSVQALHGADLTLAQGEIHALLGENGAGKSTLMSVLYGLVRPDSGSIEIHGAAVRLASPRDALRHGVGMVQQHHALVDRMSVAENLWLARPGWRTDLAAAARLVVRLGEETGLTLDPAARAGALPIGLRQRLEILKALSRDVKVLVLDEPASSLSPPETEALFASLRLLRSRGVSIVLVTHKLPEVAALADRVTVLRQGRQVFTGPASTPPARLAEAMIGRGSARVVLAARQRRDQVVLDVDEPGVSFVVHAGEIVGIAAVEGNGQRELLRRFAGMAAFIPEDRQHEGLILDLSVEENLVLADRGRFWLDRVALRQHAAAALQGYSISAAGPAAALRELSGGNQQKVLLARGLAAKPALLIAENPTRGLDIHATAEIHDRLRQAASDGCAILFYSSDLDEVLELAHRIGVMNGGRWRDVPDSGRTREKVGAMMAGA